MMVVSIFTPNPKEVNIMGEVQSTNPTPESIEENSTSIIESTGTQGSTGVQQEPEPDTVPLATFLEMKNTAKELKSKLAEVEDSKYSEQLREKKQRVRDKWIDKGFDEMTADAISEEITGIYEELGKARKTRSEMLISEQIDELSNDNFYSDIKKYEPDIKAKINQFKKAGETISVEDAYLIIAGPKTKLRESRIQRETIESISNEGTSPNVATATGTKPKNIYNLDANDKKALETLKQMQPAFQWDEKKYYEAVKKDR